jgi:hypothetical protein
MVQDYRMEAVPRWREGRWKEGDVAAKHVCEQVRALNHLLPVFGSSRPLFIATEHSLVASALRSHLHIIKTLYKWLRYV